MLRKSLAAFAGLALASSMASAATLNAGAYTITYDDSTPGFGAISSWGGSGSNVSFEWSLSSAVNVTSVGGALATAKFDMPDFTITANPGYSLSGGVTASIGNIVYFVLGTGADASVTTAFDLAVNGGPAMSAPAMSLSQTMTSPTLGYFADSATAPVGGFNSFSLSNGSIALSAWGGNAASIGAQPQNKLKIEFFAQAVPEPESYALMLAGLAVIGAIARRRSRR